VGDSAVQLPFPGLSQATLEGEPRHSPVDPVDDACLVVAMRMIAGGCTSVTSIARFTGRGVRTTRRMLDKAGLLPTENPANQKHAKELWSKVAEVAGERLMERNKAGGSA